MNEHNQIRTGGIEGKLDAVGGFYLVFSIFALFIFIFFSQDDTIKKAGLSYYLIVLGFGVLCQGILFWIIFEAGAEVIKLLKKLNGLPYGGTISVTKIQPEERIAERTVEKEEEKSYSCSECKAPVSINDTVCPKCGSTL